MVNAINATAPIPASSTMRLIGSKSNQLPLCTRMTRLYPFGTLF
jgi:hypothetical protein